VGFPRFLLASGFCARGIEYFSESPTLHSQTVRANSEQMKLSIKSFLWTLILTSQFLKLNGQDDCIKTKKLEGMAIELCLDERWKVFLDGWFVHVHIDKKYFVRIDMFPESIPNDLKYLKDYRLFSERNEVEKFTTQKVIPNLGDSAVLITDSIIHRRKNNKIKKTEVTHSIYCAFDGKIYSIFFKRNEEFEEYDVIKMLVFKQIEK